VNYSLFLILVTIFIFTSFSSAYAIEAPRYADDETLMIEGHEFIKIVDGLSIPSSMTFVDGDILVIEKNSGKVSECRLQ